MHTHKNFDKFIAWDTSNRSYDAVIYTNGGDFFTVDIEALDDDGNVTYFVRKSFKKDGRNRAIDYIDTFKRNTLSVA